MDELHLYRVVIRNISGTEISYEVASWRGPHKAVAMAVMANQARSRSVQAFDVELEDLGHAPDPIPAKALVDRMEF